MVAAVKRLLVEGQKVRIAMAWILGPRQLGQAECYFLDAEIGI